MPKDKPPAPPPEIRKGHTVMWRGYIGCVSGDHLDKGGMQGHLEVTLIVPINYLSPDHCCPGDNIALTIHRILIPISDLRLIDLVVNPVVHDKWDEAMEAIAIDHRTFKIALEAVESQQRETPGHRTAGVIPIR